MAILSSHRGGSGERAENTLEAFKNAVANGSNFLELDLALTKDEQVVVFHDNEMGRVCGPEYDGKTIEEYNYADLPKLLREVPTDRKDDFYQLRADETG